MDDAERPYAPKAKIVEIATYAMLELCIVDEEGTYDWLFLEEGISLSNLSTKVAEWDLAKLTKFLKKELGDDVVVTDGR